MKDPRDQTPEQLNPLIDRAGIHQDAVVAVGKCMLARALAIDFTIRGYEVNAIQSLVTSAPVPVTARDISNTLQEAGVAGSPRTTERTMAILRGRGILNTVTEWRTTYYSIDESVFESSERRNVERLQQAREMREKLDGGDMAYFLQLVAQRVPSQSSREQLERALFVLRQNAGWPVALKDIGLKRDHVTNPTRLVQELIDILPEGIVQKNGVNNVAVVQLNYDALIAFELPKNGEAPVYERLLTEETMKGYDGLRIQLDIRTKRALEIVALLEHHGGTLQKSTIRTLLGMEGVIVTKEKMLIAFNALRKHALIVERQMEGSQDVEVSLIPNFDRTAYGAKQTPALQKKDKKKIDAQVLAHERASAKSAKDEAKRIRAEERQRALDEQARQKQQRADEKQREREARIAESAASKAQAAQAKALRAQTSATARLLEKKQASTQAVRPKLRIILEDVPTEPLRPIADFVPEHTEKPAVTDDIELSSYKAHKRPLATKYGHLKEARISNSEKLLQEGLQFEVVHPEADLLLTAYQFAKDQKKVPLSDITEGDMQPAKLRQILTRVKTVNGTPVFRVQGSEFSLNRLFQGDRRLLSILQEVAD